MVKKGGRPAKKAPATVDTEGAEGEEGPAPKTAGRHPGRQTKTKTPAPPVDDEEEDEPAARPGNKRPSAGGKAGSAPKKQKGNDGGPNERRTASLQPTEADVADVVNENIKTAGKGKGKGKAKANTSATPEQVSRLLAGRWDESTCCDQCPDH